MHLENLFKRKVLPTKFSNITKKKNNNNWKGGVSIQKKKIIKENTEIKTKWIKLLQKFVPFSNKSWM